MGFWDPVLIVELTALEKSLEKQYLTMLLPMKMFAVVHRINKTHVKNTIVSSQQLYNFIVYILAKIILHIKKTRE